MENACLSSKLDIILTKSREDLVDKILVGTPV